jgi:drug/metabolite transporter (DMT)-like permease
LSDQPPRRAGAEWPTLLVISAAWGTTLLWIRLAGETLAPFPLTFWRAVVALAALGLYLAWRGVVPRARLRHCLVLGTTNGWLPSALMAFALGRIDTAPAALVAASMPLILSVLAHLFLPGERMTARGAAGVAIGFSGIALVLGPGVIAASTASVEGLLAMLAVAMSYASGAAYGRAARPADAAATAFGQQVMSLLVSGGLALLLGQGLAPPSTGVSIGAIIALGTVASALPIVLYWRLLARVPAATAGFVDYLIPLWATAIAVTILGETPQPTALAGGALVLVGIAVATRRVRPPRSVTKAGG